MGILEKYLAKNIYTALSRFIGMTINFAFFSFCLKNLNTKDFELYIVLSGILGILIWLLDFGSMTKIIVLLGRGSEQKSRELFGLRFTIFLTALVIGNLIILIFNFGIHILLFNAIFVDLFSDSFTGYRQISEKVFSFSTKLIGKKIVQFCILYLNFEIFVNRTLTTFAIAILIPSIVIIIFDWISIRPVLNFSNFSNYYDASGIWFQSGGSSLAMLDTFIMSNLGMKDLIPSLSFGKKIANAVGILGSNLVPETLYSWSKGKDFRKKNLRHIFIFTGIATLATILLIFLENFIVQMVFGRNLDTAEKLVLYSILISIPFGIITSNLNAILISLNKLKIASASTYLSTIVYLLTLVIGSIQQNKALFISVAVILNLIMEIVIQSFFIFRMKWNDQL